MIVTDDEYVAEGCTCDAPSEYNDADNTEMHRHLPDCALAPDIDDTWLWYPHSGELENGGVYVNPADVSTIYLEVDGYLCRVPQEK
jgi:hypothetical protein